MLGNSGRSGSPAAVAATSAASSKAAAPWALKAASAAAPQSNRAASALASHFPTAAEAQKAKAAAEEKERALAAEAAARNAAVMQQLDRFRGTSLAAGRHWDEMEDEEDGGFLDEVVEFGDGTQYKVPATKEEEDQAPVSKEDRFKDQGHDRSWPPNRRDAQQAAAPPHAQAQARPSPWGRHAPHEAADLAPEVASRSLFPARSGRGGSGGGAQYDDEATEPGSLQLLTRDRRAANASGGEHGRRGRDGYAAQAPTTGANATAAPTSVRAWGPLAQRAASLNPDAPKPAPAPAAVQAVESRPPPAAQRAPLPASKTAPRAAAPAAERALPPHLAAGYGPAPAAAPAMASSRSRSPVAHTRAPWARASDTSPDASRARAPSATASILAPSAAAAAATPLVASQRSEMLSAAERARKRRQEEEEARAQEKESARAKAAALEAVIKAKEDEAKSRKEREAEEKRQEERLREEQRARREAQEERLKAAQKQGQQQPKMPALQQKQQQAAPAPAPAAAPADERVWRRGPALPPQQVIAPTAPPAAPRGPARTSPAQAVPAVAAKPPPQAPIAPRAAMPVVAQPQPAPSASDGATSWRRAPAAAPVAPTAPAARKAVAQNEAPRVLLQRAPDAQPAPPSAPKAALAAGAAQPSPTSAAPPTGPRAMRGEAPATVAVPTAPRVQMRPPRVEIIAPTDERAASLRSGAPASASAPNAPHAQQQRNSPTSSPAGAPVAPSGAVRPSPPSAMKPARPAVLEPLTTRVELAPEAPPAWNKFVVRAPKALLAPPGLKPRGKAAARGGKRVTLVAPDGAGEVEAPPVKALSWEPPIPNLSMRTLSRDDQFFPKKFSKGKVITPVSVPKAVLPRGLQPRVFERRPAQQQQQQQGGVAAKSAVSSSSPNLRAAGGKAKKTVAVQAQVPVSEEPRKPERGGAKANAQRLAPVGTSASAAEDAWRRAPTAPAAAKHVSMDASAMHDVPPPRAPFRDTTSNATPSGPLDDPSTASPVAHQRPSAQVRPKDRRDSGSGVAFARSTHAGAALRGESPVSFMVNSELDSVRSSVQTQTPALPSPGQMGGATWGQGPLTTSFVLPTSAGADASHLKSVWAPPDRSSAPGGGARPAQNSLKGIADDPLSMPLSMHDLGTGGDEASPTAAAHGHADAGRSNGFSHSSGSGTAAQSRNSASPATTTSAPLPNASPSTAPTSEAQTLSPSMPNIGRLNLSGNGAGVPHDRSRSAGSGFGPYAYGAPFGVSPAAAAYGTSPAIRHQHQPHVQQQHGVVPGYNGYGSSPAYGASFAPFRPPLLPQQAQRALQQQQQGEMSLMGATAGVWGDQGAYSPAVVALQQQHAYAVSSAGYAGMSSPVGASTNAAVRSAPGQGQRSFSAQQAYRSQPQQQHSSPQSQSGMLHHVGAPQQHQLQQQQGQAQQAQQQQAAPSPSGTLHGAARPFAYPAYKPYDPAAGVW